VCPSNTRFARSLVRRVWDLDSGDAIVLEVRAKVTCLKFSADGKHFLSCADKFVRIWDASTLQPITKLEPHRGAVNEAVFTKDTQNVVSCSDDGSLVIYELKYKQAFTKKLYMTMQENQAGSNRILSVIAHDSYVLSVDVTRDDKYIVSGSADTNIRIWNMDLQLLRACSGHGEMVNSVAFSPDGKFFVSGSSDTSVKIWDVETAVLIVDLFDMHSDNVTSVAFSPDGTSVVAGAEDKSVSVIPFLAWTEFTPAAVHDDVFVVDFKRREEANHQTGVGSFDWSETPTALLLERNPVSLCQQREDDDSRKNLLHLAAELDCPNFFHHCECGPHTRPVVLIYW